MPYIITTQNMDVAGDCPACVEAFRSALEAAFGIPVLVGSEGENNSCREMQSPNPNFRTYGDWENFIWDSCAADCGNH